MLVTTKQIREANPKNIALPIKTGKKTWHYINFDTDTFLESMKDMDLTRVSVSIENISELNAYTVFVNYPYKDDA